MHLGVHRGTEAEVYNWFGKTVIWFEAVPYIYDGGVMWDEISEWLNNKNFYSTNNPLNFHSDIFF